MGRILLAVFVSLILFSCASPPTADPSKVELSCAQHCSDTLATCSSGFKFFPVVVQKQCNDNYDVCIGGCPARTPIIPVVQTTQPSSTSKLEELNGMMKKGLITQGEYNAKKTQILNGM